MRLTEGMKGAGLLKGNVDNTWKIWVACLNFFCINNSPPSPLPLSMEDRPLRKILRIY